MMKMILIALSTFCLISQTQAYTTLITKKTDIIEHRAYQSIFKNEYKVFNDILSQIFFETDCKTQLSLKSLQEETLFKKGKFIGVFKFKCMGNKIKDINLFFDVYPYDGESISKIEIIKYNNKKEVKEVCWKHYEDFISCEGLIDRNTKFNFH